LQDAGEGVCGISGSASVGGGCGAALGICLHDETAKVGDFFVDGIYSLFPPVLHKRIEWIKTFQAADPSWTTEVHRNG
jgi:hypothetical protein